MTTKHFIDLAKALNVTRPDNKNTEAYQVWKDTRDNIALVCKIHNTRFDREKFFRACEGGDNRH